ncbi:MAG: DUF1573 domain-containing protein [Chitinophagaceae bacterium]
MWLLVQCGIGVDKNTLPKTKVKFKDSLRHYFPILQGSELTIPYTFINTGKNPLTIIECQTSCGCTVAEFSTRPIEEGGEGTILLKFNSIKNIGYTEVFTTVIANTEPVGMHTLQFDVNVVPDALYTKDYEELYTIQEEKSKSSAKKLVDGEQQQGYYTDSTAKNYQ